MILAKFQCQGILYRVVINALRSKFSNLGGYNELDPCHLYDGWSNIMYLLNMNVEIDLISSLNMSCFLMKMHEYDLKIIYCWLHYHK